MQVDPYRTRCHAGARGDLRAGQPLHETEHERFTIGLGEAVDGSQSDPAIVRRFGRISGGRCRMLGQLLEPAPVTVESDGKAARDRRDPGAERPGVAEISKLSERMEKDLLHEIVRFLRRDAGQQNAVDHRRVPLVQTRERRTVAPAG